MDRVFVLELTGEVDVLHLVERLAAEPHIEYAEPDFIGRAAGAQGADSEIPSDPFFSRQWGLHNTGNNPVPTSLSAGADVSALGAWSVTLGDPELVVAVLDSGLRLTHPDIQARVWVNTGEIPGSGEDDDGNGFIDDVVGWNFADGTNDVTDNHGHGTNVASILGADGDNAIGYTGMDRAARIMSVKVLDANAYGLYSWWAAGMVYAVDNGARVLNMSVGGTSPSQTLVTALEYADAHGVLVVAAMMNANSSQPFYPVAYPQAFAVGATDGLDQRAVPFCWGGGSSYGNHIDISAPGETIFGLAFNSNTNYNTFWCGTSQATPFVAGTASLMLAVNPALTPAEIAAILRDTADDEVGRPEEDVPGFDPYHGYGRLNAAAALVAALKTVSREPAAGAIATLLNVYPNPVRNAASVTFELERSQAMRIGLYDVLGRFVLSLHDGVLEAGPHQFGLRAGDLATGTYVVTVTGGSLHLTRLLTVVR